MRIIGCDYHPSMQQISWVHTDSGEYRKTLFQQPRELSLAVLNATRFSTAAQLTLAVLGLHDQALDFLHRMP